MLGFRSRKLSIGVDVGSSSIKVVKLKSGPDGLQVDSLGYSRFPPDFSGEDEATVEVIKKLLGRSGLKGEGAALSFSNREIIVRYFFLPKMPLEEMRQAVFWEASKHISFSPEDLLLDFTVFSHREEFPQEQNLVMAVLAPRALIRRWLGIFSRSGIRVCAIDISAMAHLAYFDLQEAWEPLRRVALIDVGHAKTGIHILQDRRLRFTRDIPVGGEELTKTVADVLRVDSLQAEKLKIRYGVGGNGGADEEERKKVRQIVEQVLERVVIEIQRSFDYFQAQYREEPVNELRITGGTSPLPGLQEYFSHALGLEAVFDQPWGVVPLKRELASDEDLQGMGPLFTAGIGLATRKVGE